MVSYTRRTCIKGTDKNFLILEMKYEGTKTLLKAEVVQPCAPSRVYFHLKQEEHKFEATLGYLTVPSFKNKKKGNQAWYHMPLMPVLGRQKQENL